MSQQSRDFQIIKKLGEGAFSTVYSVKRISDGSVYAMKKVKMGKLSEKEKQNALNEIRILASIQHPNVIGYKEAFFENSQGLLCIVMEMADGGDLLQSIEKHKRNRSSFTEKQIWHYFVQIVRGIKALHDLKIVHRDIKCANIFLTKNGVVKLGDLNVSKVANKGLMHTQTGTPYYASPEVWKDRPYDNKSDIWSLGCVLYEMITLMPPFRATSMQGLAQKVVKGVFDPIPNRFTQDLREVVKSCIQVSPSNRPSCEKILSMPGLLNHITGTLENLDTSEINDNLLSTIRCPRNLGMITERLPKPQYQPLKRSNSMALETAKKIEIDREESLHQLVKNQEKISISEGPKITSHQKIGERSNRKKPVIMANLPTIEEDDQVDENTPEKKRRNKPILEHQKYAKEAKNERKSSQIQEEESKRKDEQLKEIYNLPSSRAGLPPTNPRSADHYLNKKKRLLNNLAPNSDRSSDVSTRVSSKQSHIRHLQLQYNSNQENSLHQSNTPANNSRPKASDLLPKLALPPLHSGRHRHQSQVLDPPFNYDEYILAQQSRVQSSRYGNRKNEISEGMSIAMGGFRYNNANNAVKLARNESKENIIYTPRSDLQQRGPRPQEYLNRRVPSMELYNHQGGPQIYQRII